MFLIRLTLAVMALGLASASAADTVRIDPDGSRHFGKASLSNVHGVWVLNLFGTREEMAFQHGRLIEPMAQDTALPFFAEKIKNAIAQTYILRDHPRFAGIAQWAVDWYVGRPLRARLPKEDRKVVTQLAKGANLPESMVATAQVVADVGQWLTTQIFGKNKLRSGAFAPIPDGPITGFGCSSFIVTSPEDAILHARNLDYESYGIFDKNPAIVYFHPSNPSEQAYASLTSLGIHTAGITAINESGLALTLHQIFIAAASRSGTPILSTTEKVIREARNLDEALSILRAAKFAGSWGIVLSSAREKKAAVVEVSADGVSVRMKGENETHFIMTNHPLTSEMKKKEFSIGYAYYSGSHARYDLLERELAARLTGKSLSEQDAVDLISEGVVAKMNNVQSVVFRPDSGYVYLAVPPAGVVGAKPLEGQYVALPLNFHELGDFNSLNQALAKMPRPLGRTVPYDSPVIEGHALYRTAARLATEHGDLASASKLIAEAVEKDRGEILYRLTEAFTFLKMATETKVPVRKRQYVWRAAEWLESARALSPSPYQKSLIELFEGRIADVLGARQSALEHYGSVEPKFSRPLTEAAKDGVASRFRLKDFRKIVIDYMHGDVFRF